DALADAIRGNTRLIWFESPSNPEMKITAFAAIAELARARGIVTVCDSTLASPVLQRPLEHGIDAVMHSSTKYLGGHSDMLGGVLVTRNAELARRLRAWQAESDRKSTRLNSSHVKISYAVFCLKKKNEEQTHTDLQR